MPKIDVLTIEGAKSGRIELPAEIFAAKINRQLVAQAVKVYLANQRKSGAKVKTRAEVSGSRRKIWRQKGTGRARHGDRYAPIFVGGGVAHGPTGQQNFKLKMAKKMKKKALFSVLTAKFKQEEILVVAGLEKLRPKTKEAVQMFKSLPLRDRKKILLVLPKLIEGVMRAARNIEGVKIIQANLLNPYEVLNGGVLVFMKESIPVLKETFLAKADLKGRVVSVVRKGRKAEG